MTFSVNWKEKEKQCLLGGPRTTFMLILIIYNRTLCTAEPPAPARAGSTAAGAGTERASGVPGPAPCPVKRRSRRGSPIPTAGQVPRAQGAARARAGGLAGLSGLLGGRSAPGAEALAEPRALCGCACVAVPVPPAARPGPAAGRAAFPRAHPPRRRAPADNSKMEDAPSQPLINNVARCLPV